MAGRSLPHAVLMMIPEPWQNHESMSPELRAFYEYHSSLMEPWDGPASIAFTDGTLIGAVLDRNGLRPSRYYVTKDDLVIMASEVGVLDIPAGEHRASRSGSTRAASSSSTRRRGASSPTRRSRASSRRAQPYARMAARQPGRGSKTCRRRPYLPPPDHDTVLRRQRAFGYTQEDLKLVLGADGRRAGEEPIGSMGTDTPLAVLSERPRLLYDYFKQLFAQVTNPPLDAIREELVTSMESTVGPEGNLLRAATRSRAGRSTSPTRSSTTISSRSCATSTLRGFESVTLPMLYRAERRRGGPRARARRAARAGASEAVKAGHTILILSDRGVNAELRADPEPARDRRRASPPGARRHADALRRWCSNRATRARCITSRCSIGYGAGAVNPYLAFETLDDMIRQHVLDRHHARARGLELHQGAQQGHPEGDVEDGDLDAAELLRGADLRGDRPRPGVRRSLFHVDRVADRRRRHRGHRRGSAAAARARVPDARRRPRAISTPAANISGGATASTTCSTRRRSSSSSTRPAPGSTASTASTRRS